MGGDTTSPVIKTGVAAKRLKVLFPQGVQPSDHLLSAFSTALGTDAENGAASSPLEKKVISATLNATVLDSPSRVHDDEFLGGSGRDILAEAAVTLKSFDDLEVMIYPLLFDRLKWTVFIVNTNKYYIIHSNDSFFSTCSYLLVC